MASNKFYQQIFIIFLIFFFLIFQIKYQCNLPQYLIEEELICVDKNKYPNYYVDNNNILKKCDYPCYECSDASDDYNQNCISCERGYEFDSTTNSCIKCPKNRYKYIYSSYNTCIDANENFCRKEITKCSLFTEELFIECPSDIPVLIESKKMCVAKNICNNTEFLNEKCKISNINYIESRKLNPFYFINDENLKNKHNIAVVLDNYENILFEACDDYDEYRYYYGIKKNGNSNFTDNFNKPTYYKIYVDGYSGNHTKKNNFILLDFSAERGNYFISFFPPFNFELESFSLDSNDNFKIKMSNLYNIIPSNEDKQKLENYTISSIINSFALYNSPAYYTFTNLYLISFVGFNNLNEYCLFIYYGTIRDINFDLAQMFFKQIKPVDNFKRISLCITNSKILIILYLNINHELKSIVFEYVIGYGILNNIGSEPTINDNIENDYYFSCLSLYEEIVIFIYFKDENLLLSIKNIISRDNIVNYNDEFNNLIILNIEEKYYLSPLY